MVAPLVVRIKTANQMEIMKLYLLCNFLLFENLAKKLGNQLIHCWFPNLKVGDRSPPVPTVLVLMITKTNKQ